MSESEHTPELAEALKKMLRELAESIPDIRSNDFPTRTCAANRLGFAEDDLLHAITEIGKKDSTAGFDGDDKALDDGVHLIATAPRMLEALRKVRRLRNLDCEMCSCRFGSQEKLDLRNEAVAIEEEINAVIGEAGGVPW